MLARISASRLEWPPDRAAIVRAVKWQEIQEDPNAFAPGRADFAGAAFGDEARFAHADFGPWTNFDGARFKGRVWFTNWDSNNGISPDSELPFAARYARLAVRAPIRPPINIVFTLFAHHGGFGASSPSHVAIRLPQRSRTKGCGRTKSDAVCPPQS
ncbi:MAG: pentapeptide repeat-containing protein [Beijerinckiaceae bacterium]